MTDTASIDVEVLKTLADVLHEPADELHAQSVLAAHDWDSMTSLEVLSQLESRLGISLDLRSYHSARTVEDLIEIVAAAVASAGQR